MSKQDKSEPLKFLYNFKAMRSRGFTPHPEKLIEKWKHLRDLEPEELEKEFGVK